VPVSYESLVGHVEELVQRAVRHPAPDVLRAIEVAVGREEDKTARGVLETILERAQRAKHKGRGLVTDPGLVSFFVRVGSEFPGLKHLQGALSEGVARATKHEPIVVHTQELLSGELCEGNRGMGVPVVHSQIVAGSSDLQIAVLAKGAASELLSSLWVLPPEALEGEVGDRLVSLLSDAGGRPCPPLVIGVGLGGTPEAAMLSSRRALLRPVGDGSADKALGGFEKEWARRLNETGVGPMGLGGGTSVLAVHVEASDRHSAFLSVGVSVACWSDCRASMVVDRQGQVHWQAA
jgi:fumarate hydratase subunit alpha